MTKKYSDKDHNDAREFYVADKMGYLAIAEITGINIATLAKWGRNEKWKDQRIERIKLDRSYAHRITRIRDKVLSKAESEKATAQDIYAVVQLERLAIMRERKEDTVDKVGIFTEHIDFVVRFLRDNHPDLLRQFGGVFRELVDAYKEEIME